LVSALHSTAEAAKQRRKAGLLVVIDELGKFLEFAADRPSEGDVFLLQQMAEAVARSPIPITFLTVLHSGFADYLPASEELRRNEWQKVQGRFQDIAYQLPAEQVLELISAAIDGEPSAELREAWGRAVEASLEEIPFHEVSFEAALRRAVARCAPLHPITLALLWPLFRSKGAQNERSLFSFLTSSEPFGFASWLENTSADSRVAPLYRVPRLYDYVTQALGMGTFRGERARRWAQIEETLARLPIDSPTGTADVVKSIGLIDILGGQVGLRADRSTIMQAVDPWIDAVSMLQFLEERSLVLFRRHLGAFGLWEGSDFDLESAFQDAQARVRRGGSLAQQLTHLFPPRPWVAQRHYLNTGTMRFFEVVYTDESEEDIASVLDEPTDADGRVVFALPLSGQLQLAVLGDQIGRLDRAGKPLILATPRDLGMVSEDLLEVEAWDHVAHSYPELTADQAARKEVRARLQASRERLARKLGPHLGLPGHLFDPSLVNWRIGSEVFSGVTVEEFKLWLSGILDDVYNRAPTLKNELLNRSVLSSAASKARRNLLEAMLRQSHRSRLGFDGYPPERSMYESMVFSGGFHRDSKNGWRFTEPRRSWLAAYRYIGTFVQGAISGRRPVSELYDALRRPPFGLRDGPIPVLFTAYLIEKADVVALYEDGVLVPDLRMEVIERILRRPELFEVRNHQLTADQAKALTLLGSLASSTTADELARRPEKALIPVVRSLIGSVAGLPPYSRQTRRLEPHDAVAERMRVLTRAYPVLLDEIEQQVRGVFGLSGTSEAAYHQLQQRALVVQAVVADQRLRTFVLEASRDLVSRDWREGLARTLREGLPVTHWKDHDVVVFQMRLREIASDFLRLEELAAEQGKAGARRVVRIGLLEDGGQEIRRVIPIMDQQDPEVLRLMEALSAVLQDRTDGSADDTVTQLEALGRVAAELMREQHHPSSEAR
jgi:hypothetical protein